MWLGAGRVCTGRGAHATPLHPLPIRNTPTCLLQNAALRHVLEDGSGRCHHAGVSKRGFRQLLRQWGGGRGSAARMGRQSLDCCQQQQEDIDAGLRRRQAGRKARSLSGGTTCLLNVPGQPGVQRLGVHDGVRHNVGRADGAAAAETGEQGCGRVERSPDSTHAAADDAASAGGALQPRPAVPTVWPPPPPSCRGRGCMWGRAHRGGPRETVAGAPQQLQRCRAVGAALTRSCREGAPARGCCRAPQAEAAVVRHVARRCQRNVPPPPVTKQAALGRQRWLDGCLLRAGAAAHLQLRWSSSMDSSSSSASSSDSPRNTTWAARRGGRAGRQQAGPASTCRGGGYHAAALKSGGPPPHLLRVGGRRQAGTAAHHVQRRSRGLDCRR